MHLRYPKAATSPIFVLIRVIQLRTFALVLCSPEHRKESPNQKFVQSDVEELILFEDRYVSILRVYEKRKTPS
jgi:hypothetical protein